MRFELRGAVRWLLVAVTLSLSSCGGGGSAASGGASSASSASYPLTLSMTPSTLKATLVQGVSQVLTVDAEVSGTAPAAGAVYVVIDDTSGVLQPTKVQITQTSTTTYVATVVTSTTLPPGQDNGAIDVRVCSDPSCSTVYGQRSLPYDFVVDPDSDITSLSAFAGIPDWQTERGDASQASYVPMTLDPSSFSVRWLQGNMEQMVPGADVTGASLVTDSADQLVIMMIPATENVTTGASSAGGLIACSEVDGTPVWHEVLTDSSGTTQDAGPLAISNGVLYATQQTNVGFGYTLGTGSGGDMSFTGLTATTGAVLFRTPISDTFTFNQTSSLNRGCTPGSPVVSSGTVIVNPGCVPDGSSTALPLSAFDGTTGQLLWTGSAQGGNLDTAAAVNGGGLYISTPSGTSNGPALTAMAPGNGALQWQAALTDGIGGYSYSTPALDGSGGAIVGASTSGGFVIDRYDLASGQLTWHVAIDPPGAPALQALAVGNGAVYAGYGGALPGEAATVSRLSAADGSTTWSWSPPASSLTTRISDIIATDNLLFVSTNMGVYAVDLGTHQTVWTLAVPGEQMAISPSGILYIVTATQNDVESGSYASSDQALLAVNLH